MRGTENALLYLEACARACAPKTLDLITHKDFRVILMLIGHKRCSDEQIMLHWQWNSVLTISTLIAGFQLTNKSILENQVTSKTPSVGHWSIFEGVSNIFKEWLYEGVLVVTCICNID